MDRVTSSDGVNYGAVLALAAISFMLLRKWIAGGVCKSCARLDGKTVVITGANTGIGRETARDMAHRGARVIMACRDLTRAESTAEYIRRSTGNGNVVIRHLNLASLYSVREFAKEFIATEERLDILINNAGVMMCPKWITEDGFETQLAVNHLGHFLLTNLLLGMLKRSSPSRVVNVSSVAHVGGTGVSSYCLHPGVIRTELNRHILLWYPMLKTILSLPSMLLMKTPWQGAQTSIYCAVIEGLERKSGCYFRMAAQLKALFELRPLLYSDCAEKHPAPEGEDDAVARRLWEESAQLVGLNNLH
ncbi:retinol dehydrogenase 13 isoform X3 [Chanodichthys erythropterus]|uniref:retinol dehydrogenase 13 isoform X3 n=1 Tax=Chanodichthys erythropterus TaxID=933992 RepID=UPI00351DDE1B